MSEIEKQILKGVNRIIELLEPKSAKKLDQDHVYKIAEKKCKTCDGLISWDGWEKGKFPIHVDSNGKIIGDGKCTEYKPKE